MKLSFVIFVVVLAAVFIFVGPIFSILALNTLFGLSIPVNVYTWLASFWLTMILTTKNTINSKK